MDIKIEKKKGIQKKHLPWLVGGLLLTGIIAAILFGNHQPTLQVKRKNLITGKAERTTFHDFIRVDGQVQPISMIQLSPLEGGIVEEIRMEEGSTVKKGDILVRLSNSNLDLSILNSEAELAEKQNFLRNTQVTMEQDKLNNRTEKLQLDLDVRRKRRAYQQQKELYDEKLIAREIFLQAEEDYLLATEKQALVTERLRQDSIFRSVQIDQLEESLLNMRQNMVLIRQRVENLNIKAPVDGELGLLEVVAGQNIVMGQKIGQINNLSDYKIEALIDEHYIDRVKTGLSGIFERQNQHYSLEVRKIYPEVRDGRFKTDFIFTGDRPENIRTGQTYYISLELGRPAETILIPKGTFFQTTGGLWVFVLDPDGKKARKRNIRIGRQNPQYYEVAEGLQPGEQIIISDYESFKENEILVIED
ncbi:MAG: efflux RND transporter periplasmic adaptor subunit [Bacteroidales bacterium]